MDKELRRQIIDRLGLENRILRTRSRGRSTMTKAELTAEAVSIIHDAGGERVLDTLCHAHWSRTGRPAQSMEDIKAAIDEVTRVVTDHLREEEREGIAICFDNHNAKSHV